MPSRFSLLALLFALLFSGTALAQDQPVRLSLKTADTHLNTGQNYTVDIHIDGASSLWLADLTIDYDPQAIYVVGTKSGSPVHPGELFAPPASIALVQNLVKDTQLIYTISLLAPMPPAPGTGVIGTFTIYPLSAGTTHLTFHQAFVYSATAGELNGQPVANTQKMTVTPVQLDLTITGDPATPPSEATATPLPTETPIVATFAALGATELPTLVNVTAAPDTPQPSAVPVPLDTAGSASSSSVLLILAVALMLVGAVGLFLVVRAYRRK